MAACCLHNFLMRDSNSQMTYGADLLDSGDNFQCTNNLSQQGDNRSTLSANETRDKFCTYFNSIAGAVSWRRTFAYNQILFDCSVLIDVLCLKFYISNLS